MRGNSSWCVPPPGNSAKKEDGSQHECVSEMSKGPQVVVSILTKYLDHAFPTAEVCFSGTVHRRSGVLGPIEYVVQYSSSKTFKVLLNSSMN